MFLLRKNNLIKKKRIQRIVKIGSNFFISIENYNLFYFNLKTV